MNTDEKLVYMANQIAANFVAMRRADPTAATAEHLAKFWDPGMRARIVIQSRAPDSGLSAIAEAAVTSLREADPA